MMGLHLVYVQWIPKCTALEPNKSKYAIWNTATVDVVSLYQLAASKLVGLFF